MKLFIDDIREAPDETWIVARNYDEAIRVLETGIVSEISFDHDLGEDSLSGYDVICWLEKRYYIDGWTFVPKMSIHSANPVGRKRIQFAIDSINRVTGKGV